ncbi:MAG: hypothetical protein QXS32_08070 [Candidatus Nezhaarchaeales archaeon]
MKIYTPGHGTYPDTLIMYGLSRAAFDAGTLLGVKGAGNYYEIEIVNDLESLASNLAFLIENEKLTIIEEVGWFTQPAERKKLERALEYLSDKRNCLQLLNKLMKIGHANEEGRGKGDESVPLAFIPYAGKYLAGQFKYKAKAYKLCIGCLGLLSYGFFEGTVRIPQHLLTVTVAFEGNVDSKCIGEVLGSLKIDRGEVGKFSDLVPLRTLIYIITSKFGWDVVVSMNEANASWKGIATKFDKVRAKFDKVRAVMQVRGMCELTLDPVLDALSRVRGDNFQAFLSLLENLRKTENSTALIYLFEYLFKRDIDILARASRSIYQSVPMGEKLVKILAGI